MGNGCCSTFYPFSYDMKRSIDAKFRGFTAVLGTSVAQLVVVEVVDAIFWSGSPEKQYHYESTSKLVYYTQLAPKRNLYHSWRYEMVAIHRSWEKWGAVAPRAARNVAYFSVRAVKLADLRVESGQKCAIAPVLYLRCFAMIVGRILKENFAGFVHFFLVWWGV